MDEAHQDYRKEGENNIFHIYSIPSTCVQCTLYRHEVPVCADDIRIVHMDDDIVVVNKPASIPVGRLFLKLLSMSVYLTSFPLPSFLPPYILLIGKSSVCFISHGFELGELKGKKAPLWESVSVFFYNFRS
jgi:hypothetical protein